MEVVLCYFTTGVLASDIPMLRAIPEDNPLRKHLLTPARTLLFVITKQHLGVHECPLDPNLLTMTSPRGHDAGRLLETAVLQHLCTVLLEVADEIQHARQLYIVPHGPLHLVSFAALLDKFPHRLPQAEDLELIYAPSATMLCRSLTADAHNAMTLGATSQLADDNPCLAVGI